MGIKSELQLCKKDSLLCFSPSNCKQKGRGNWVKPILLYAPSHFSSSLSLFELFPSSARYRKENWPKERFLPLFFFQLGTRFVNFRSISCHIQAANACIARVPKYCPSGAKWPGDWTQKLGYNAENGNSFLLHHALCLGNGLGNHIRCLGIFTWNRFPSVLSSWINWIRPRKCETFLPLREEVKSILRLS